MSLEATSSKSLDVNTYPQVTAETMKVKQTTARVGRLREIKSEIIGQKWTNQRNKKRGALLGG